MSLIEQRIKAVVNVLSGREYPPSCYVHEANQETIDFIKTTNCRMIAEIGIYKGHTSEYLAQYLNGQGELHLFDFDERVREVKDKLHAAGYNNIVGHGNTHKTMDSYNWSLMRVLQKHAEPIYDYVFLDGAHTWNLDALAFLLVDRLLKIGGYIDLDDFRWNIEYSQTMNPQVFPATKKMYTPEQIREPHVKLVIDLLVKRDPRYTEIVTNKIYKKIAYSDFRLNEEGHAGKVPP
jgi:predicted O-methyltransferase YrrM